MTAEAASEVFGRIDRPLWLVTAAADGRRGGLIATFVGQASLVPELPRVLVGIARHHHTHALVERSRAFGLHLLGDEHLEWVWRFGLRSGHDVDKLEGLELLAGPSGAPRLAGAASWLDCRVEAGLDTGDRTVFLAEVLDAEAGPSRPVLTVARMLERAPEEHRTEMASMVRRDCVIDRDAIEAWRRDRRSGLI